MWRFRCITMNLIPGIPFLSCRKVLPTLVGRKDSTEILHRLENLAHEHHVLMKIQEKSNGK
jgi:hypothetical protein